MTPRRGPRPTAIRWFAALFLSATATALVHAAMNTLPQSDGPKRDLAIILTCVKLTIALLTAGLVWFYAMRFARWLVPLGVAAKLAFVGWGAFRAGLPALMALSPLFYLSTALDIAAAISLFTEGGTRWFQPAGKASDALA